MIWSWALLVFLYVSGEIILTLNIPTHLWAQNNLRTAILVLLAAETYRAARLAKLDTTEASPSVSSLLSSSHGAAVSWLLYLHSYFSQMTGTGFSFFPALSFVSLKKQHSVSTIQDPQSPSWPGPLSSVGTEPKELGRGSGHLRTVCWVELYTQHTQFMFYLCVLASVWPWRTKVGIRTPGTRVIGSGGLLNVGPGNWTQVHSWANSSSNLTFLFFWDKLQSYVTQVGTELSM